MAVLGLARLTIDPSQIIADDTHRLLQIGLVFMILGCMTFDLAQQKVVSAETRGGFGQIAIQFELARFFASLGSLQS